MGKVSRKRKTRAFKARLLMWSRHPLEMYVAGRRPYRRMLLKDLLKRAR